MISLIQGRPVQILKGGNNFFSTQKMGVQGRQPPGGGLGAKPPEKFENSVSEALRKIRFLTKYTKFGGSRTLKKFNFGQIKAK